MSIFTIIYTAVGGLGIFFYGMKTMSEALQQAASDMITKVINSLTSNPIMAVLVGTVVTMIVQSSSVTTVMTVGLVNAGLMKLSQAIGVVFGTNIGTTITGWIISIKVGKYGLLFIGLGALPTLFARSANLKTVGRVLFGIGMIFVGLEFMSSAFKPLRSHEGFLSFLSLFGGSDYFSYGASILVGMVLTLIIQSSSAMLGITIAMASTGIINFDTAVALVFGENIGTTITALLASIGTTLNARRTAYAHALFNCLGVAAVFFFLPMWVEMIEWLIPMGANFIDEAGNKPYIAEHIAASHTFFNVLATLIFLPFIRKIEKLVMLIAPGGESKEKETPRLQVLGDAADIVPATSISQAHSEVLKMKDIIDRAFRNLDECFKKNDFTSSKIHHYEQVADNMQKEVTLYLCKVMEHEMSEGQTMKTAGLIKIADELESISDYIERIFYYQKRYADNGLAGKSLNEFVDFKNQVVEYYNYCAESILDFSNANFKEAELKSIQLKNLADHIRDNHLERIKEGSYDPLSSLTYSDMVVALRKIRAHSLNIVETCQNFTNA